jgi:hypothetical protein
MPFKIVHDVSNVVIIDYYTPSLFNSEGSMHSSIGIYAKDIPDLIKALRELGF